MITIYTMHSTTPWRLLTLVVLSLQLIQLPAVFSQSIGMFEDHRDIGTVLHPGSVEFDAEIKRYTIAGSGENMWRAADAFHYVWKQAAGDLSLAATIDFIGKGVEPHRKACLMIRQSLDADSAYVDIALHGDGLASLQWRLAKGEDSHEVGIDASAAAPTKRVRLEKRGKYATMYIAADGEELHYSGAAVRIQFTEPFYVGLGVCAHNAKVTEKAIFDNVELNTSLPAPAKPPTLYSTLETQTIASTDRRVLYVTPTRIEAPNWLRDGSALIYNTGGRIMQIPVAGGAPKLIDTGFANQINNDHVISSDGKMLGISDQSQLSPGGLGLSLIYTLPITGGTPKLITPTGPSYLHGWSPDGKTLAFCGRRDNEFDIYAVSVDGGEQTRLTTAKGLDDGPEYSNDGRYIYFNSDRTGLMQAYRMKPDGSEQEMLTSDQSNNWFPHVSPDGQTIVFVTFEKDVAGHPQNKDVMLRMMNLSSRKITVLSQFFGGQGTANTNCWSPDGKKIAFITYRLIP